MVTAFCPGHITCFFRPSGNPGDNPLRRGSAGAGVRTSLGATVEVTERSGSSLKIVMDGENVSASVTESVFGQMAPYRGFDVTVTNGLPCGEGFGMSAAGAIAAALCLAEICGTTEQRAFEVAHCAEIEGGGGLGDVSAIYCPVHQPVRVTPGLPPGGNVIGTDVSFPRLSLAVLGSKMHTGNILGNSEKYRAIVSAGNTAVREYLSEPNVSSMFRISNVFSQNTSLESAEVTECIGKLQSLGCNAAMCMLGNSIFSDMPVGELEKTVGDAQVFSCASTDKKPKIIRKG